MDYEVAAWVALGLWAITTVGFYRECRRLITINGELLALAKHYAERLANLQDPTP